MRKILIVDDKKANRVLLQKMLNNIYASRDCEILEASNGDEAINIYGQSRPDLILMDYSMPEKTGCETAREIKSLEGDNYLPIIFVTAMNSDDVLKDSLSSGGDDYIGKPFDLSVLQAKIHAHLRIKELNDNLNEKYQYLSREQDLIEHYFENALSNSFLDKRYINYHMSSLSAFNGDLFLVNKGPNGGLYILVGDFTGHGLSAAIGTLPVSMIFFKMTKKGLSLEALGREINSQLHSILPTNMFFAANLMYLDSSGRELLSWMGGMPDCYRIGQNREILKRLESNHLPMGILSDEEFRGEPELHHVDIGDKLYLFTDGVTEATGHKYGEMYRLRLEQVLSNKKNARFEDIITDFKEFTGKNEQKDDITIVEIHCQKISED